MQGNKTATNSGFAQGQWLPPTLIRAHRHKYIRYNNPSQAHCLTFICYKNRRFLDLGWTRQYFAEAVYAAREKHQFDVWAYVVMPEHIHLVIFPRLDYYSISGILKSLKQPVARRALNYLRLHNSGLLPLMETGLAAPRYRFWQDGGGYDRNIRSGHELLGLIDYVHNNPVRRGLVDRAEEWYWSSAGDWMCDRRGPIEVDRTHFPLS